MPDDSDPGSRRNRFRRRSRRPGREETRGPPEAPAPDVPPKGEDHVKRTEREKTMTHHETGTREEWLAARLELLEAEKELTRHSDELARRRQQLPWVRVGKEYRFEIDEGRASLADLFRGRSQLLVYHFMFGPDY